MLPRPPSQGHTLNAGPTSSQEARHAPFCPGMPTDLRRDRRVTPFMQSVYDLVSTIPEGKVSTYGAVAQALRSSARAVGQALRGNPFAPVVPCHRVVASTLELGGFSGTWGDTPEVSKKRTMLVAEVPLLVLDAGL